MNFENKKPIIILKNEHLKEGIKPIISGIYDRNNLDRDTQYFLDAFKKDADFVNFSYRSKDIKENAMYNSGDTTYVMSLLNNRNKYSLAYLDCTGIVAVGTDRETGENISFMSHQNPDSFLEDDYVKTNFKNDLNKNFDNLISKCIPGSIDVVILGGNKEDVSENVPNENFRLGFDDIDQYLKGPFDQYIKSVKFLSHTIKQKIGFTPIVISGPNDNFETAHHSLSAYFDNKNRRLYMVKPKQENNTKNEAFEASKVEDQIKNF